MEENAQNTKQKQDNSFETKPVKLLLVGAGFLGKYLLERQFEGFEQYIKTRTTIEDKQNEQFFKPLTYIIDKQNPDLLYRSPVLENFQNKGYSEYLWQSMGDTSTLQKKKIHEKVDHIVITSAIADVPYAMASPADTYQTNVMNMLQFMEYLRINDFEGKIINMSSESTYGHQSPDKLPLKEDCLPNPSNVYGSSKLAQEQILLTYAKSYGLNCCVLKSATMYGPYGRTKQAIPIFIKQILEKKPITLEGDGSQSRDFVYVEDTARAIELALYTTKDIKGEIINVGSGKEVKFINLINAIRFLIGLKEDEIKIDYKPFRPGEEGLRVKLSIEKAENLLDYRPQIPLTPYLGGQSGLTATIAWIAQDVLNYDKEEMEKLYNTMMPDRKYWKIQNIEEVPQNTMKASEL